MHTLPNQDKVTGKKTRGETPKERVERLYCAPGGPLLGWLKDEADKRGESSREMAAQLGVTLGYVEQLASGLRPVNEIPQNFADACSRYLNVPTIVIKLLSGNIRMADFLHRAESEHEMLDRAMRDVQADPQLCDVLPRNLLQLPTEAKKTIALMYAEVTSGDVFNIKALPETVYWLQRTAVLIDEASDQAGT